MVIPFESDKKNDLIETNHQNDLNDDINVANNDDEFDVNFLHGKKTIAGKVKYLVRWLGYPPESDTWEPLKSFDGLNTNCIDEFETQLAKNGSKITCKIEEGKKVYYYSINSMAETVDSTEEVKQLNEG